MATPRSPFFPPHSGVLRDPRGGVGLCAGLLLLLLFPVGPVAAQRPGAAPLPAEAAVQAPTDRSEPLLAPSLPRFVIHCDAGCPVRVIRMAEDAAEAAWEESAALLGVSPDAPEEPLPIHLYRTREAWEEAEGRLTAGRFREQMSFTHGPSGSAHIALQQNLSTALLTRYGPTPRTLRLVAHEAFHLISDLALPAQELLPEWLAEGGAAWVEQRVAERLGWSRGLTEDPVPSTYLWLARRLLFRDQLTPLAQLLLPDPARPRLVHAEDAGEYALPMLLVTHLYESRRSDLELVFQAVASMDAGDPAGARRMLNREISRALGGPRFDEVDRSFRAFLAQRRPSWVEAARSLETAGGSWVQVGVEEGALAWRTTAIAGELRLAGVLEFLGAAPDPWMRVVLGETEGGRVEIRIGGSSSILVVRVPPGAGVDAEGEVLAGWSPPAFGLSGGGIRGPVARVGGAEAASPRPSRLAPARPDALLPESRAVVAEPPVRRSPIPFLVAVREEGVEVLTGGESRVFIPASLFRLDGSWGIGTAPGVSGVWHNLRVVPVRPVAADEEETPELPSR